jgi:hypothetical protein
MPSWNKIINLQVMIQEKNLTPEEIEKINSIQQRIQDVVITLGEIEFQKIQLWKQHEYTKQLLNQIEEEEYLLEQELSKKYNPTEPPIE